MVSRGASGRPSLVDDTFSLAPGIAEDRTCVDGPGMDAAPGNRRLDERGAPRLLNHWEAFERMIGPQGRSARARLDVVLGGELASLLCRALTRPPGFSRAI